jgi:23S rRNA (uracil1939-C5)-methyltransferase
MTGERLRGRVLRNVNGGYGLLRVDGQTVFARDALKDEDVTVTIQSRRKGVLFGEVVDVHVAHPQRRTAPCEVAFRCGGCHYQGASAEAQAAAKREGLEELLQRAHIETPVSAWHAGPEFGWRARIELHGARTDDGFALGFFEEKSHRVVPARSCLQVSERMRSMIALFSQILDESAARAGSIEVVESFDGEGIVAVASDPIVAAALRKRAHETHLRGLGVKETRDEARVIHGDLSLDENIGSVKLAHHAMSFFQANRFMTPALLNGVLEAVGSPGVSDNGRVVDLFCGVGLFAVPLAVAGHDVTAIEWNQTAFDDLGRNAKVNGVKVERLPLGVGTALATGLQLKGSTTIVDPPRRGLDPIELDAIAAGRPAKIVYVSCDPATLARDLVRFASLGYGSRSIQAFDMFPTTFHLETLAVLGRD